jgi:Cu2+-exporting ATPase
LLFPIATAFDVAEKTKHNIFQNLAVSLTYNSAITLVAAGLFIAIGFALNPALGVALAILESIIILANLEHFKQQEVVSAASYAHSVVIDEEAPGNTTAKILDALGYRSQLRADLSIVPEPKTGSAPARSLFASHETETLSSHNSEELAPEDLRI